MRSESRPRTAAMASCASGGGERADRLSTWRHTSARAPTHVHVSPVRVRNHTQTHIHIHTRASHAKVGPAEGGLKGRHAHGELEAHGGCGERYGIVASARTTAAEIAARW